MSKIAVVYGSSRPSKAGEAVAKYFVDGVELPSGVELDLVDLAEVDLPLLAEPMPPITGQYEMESTKKWSDTVSGYNGFVFVVAEYNLGYTPILKNAIDTLFKEWNKKSAAIISYGAFPVSKAAEQFRQVLSPFEMKLADASLHISPIHEVVSEDGIINEGAASGDSPQEVLDSLLVYLT